LGSTDAITGYSSFTAESAPLREFWITDRPTHPDGAAAVFVEADCAAAP
jgi:hypothetical protein